MSDEALEALGRYPASGRIRIELATPLHVEFEGVASRTTGMLVGMEVDEYLIIKLTSALGAVASRLFKGNLLVVRYLFEGTVYGFQCKSLGSVASPARLLFVSYPTIVAERVIRSRQRVPCRLPVLLETLNGALAALLLDVNSSGGRVWFVPEASLEEQPPALPEVDESLGMALKLPGVATDLQLTGTVRNRRVDSHGCQLGLAFEPADETATEAIERFMSEMRAVD